MERALHLRQYYSVNYFFKERIIKMQYMFRTA